MAEDGWPSYGTNEDKDYRFRPLRNTTLRFVIKAAHDCHLAFSPEAEATSEMFEIFIGGWEGQASAIRFKKDNDIAKVDTPDILNGDEVRGFWVTWEDDFVRVGREGEHSPFMEAALPEHIDVNFFGYSTGWGAEGWWQFYHERQVHTNDCNTYTYEPVYGRKILVGVECANDAHISLTSGPEDTPQMYEIFIGGWENQKSAIRLDKDSDQTVSLVETPNVCCADEMRFYWVTFKDGHIRVGHEGNFEPFMEYMHPEPYYITHFGYSTCWGASGKWKLEM